MKRKTGAASPSYNWARSKLITQAGVLAKRANQRLREIEKQGLQGVSNAYKYVERSAKKDKRFWTAKTSKGQIKFNTNFRKMSDKQIREAIRQMRGFSEAKTSRTKGVRKKLEKLTQKFNEKTGLGLNTGEFSDIMSENLTQELFKQFSPSDVTMLFRENPDAARSSEEILQALIDRESQQAVQDEVLEKGGRLNLAELEFSEIQEAYEAFQIDFNK